LSISFSATKRRALLLLALLVLFCGCAPLRETPGPAAPAAGGETMPAGAPGLVAVFPVENLSGMPAPLPEIRARLIALLREGGFTILEEAALESFMAAHRVRYTGGIDGDTARALREETGAQEVLITSLELYNEIYPPRIALTCRLVTLGNPPVIRWIDNVGMSGDESPGLFAMGLIEEPAALRDQALQTLVASLQQGLRDGEQPAGAGKRFRPRISYRSDELGEEPQRFAVAVMPFFNLSDRKNAGDIMVLHFVKELHNLGAFDVVEPGLVYRELLRFRIIMDDGVSLANADAVFSSLNVDLLMSGKVLDYQDALPPWGAPYVDFSTVMIHRQSRGLVWASKSYNRGSDGVYFFDLGRISTANDLASQMSRAIGEMILGQQ
jgi:TolB-like protein